MMLKRQKVFDRIDAMVNLMVRGAGGDSGRVMSRGDYSRF
jgi:hypothetical protein